MSDLISRQAAIDALDTGLWGVEWDKALATAMLKDLPSAQPAQRWIAVTEKLPAAFHQVLCYGHNGIMIDYFSGETTEIYGNPLFMISEAKITHWMPLPEPPKEEP